MEDEKDLKPETADETQKQNDQVSRRNFLRGLGKWSLAVIGSVALGAVAAPPEAKGWVNGGGSWVNRRGGGGGWINGGGGGGGWINRGGSWINGRGGGGGGSWVNRRGY